MTRDSKSTARIERLLRKLANGGDQREILDRILALISDASGCESVGIRLKAGGDCPYFVTRGFGQDFVVIEGPLCTRDAGGLILRHADGTPQLACMCGAVVEGRTDPSQAYFTPGGSFWTNGTTQLLRNTPSILRDGSVRAYCNAVGYESLALIPLRARGKVHGLLQLNSRTPGRFRPEQFRHYESMATAIAEALNARRKRRAD